MVFDSKESRDAFNFVREYILENLPPGAVDRAAFDLIDLRQDAIDRHITALRDEVSAAMARADPAPSPSMLFQGSLHILKSRLHGRDGGRKYRSAASIRAYPVNADTHYI